eukprot:gene21111-25348_t
MTSGEFTAELRWDAAEGKLVYFKNGEHVGEIVDQGLRQTELRLVISFGRNIGQVFSGPRTIRLQVNNAIDRFYIGLVDCSWEPDGIES